MKAPPDNMKIVSFNSKVIKSMLNKDIVLDIILKVKHVRQFLKKFVKKKIRQNLRQKELSEKDRQKKSSKNETGFFKISRISIKKKIYTVINILTIN